LSNKTTIAAQYYSLFQELFQNFKQSTLQA